MVQGLERYTAVAAPYTALQLFNVLVNVLGSWSRV